MEKYVISNGYEGLGDRLQCLSYCLDFALKHNRILKVNWGNREWNGDFHQYFRLVNVPYTVDKIDFEGKSVWPPIWKALGDRCSEDWAYDIKEERLEPSTHDVIVHPGIGFRIWNMPLLSRHLRLASGLNCIVKESTVVHLRGTDRYAQGSDLKAIYKQSGDAYVVTDDARLAQQWAEISPGSIISCAGVEGHHPVHKTPESNAFNRNARAVIDFMLIALADKAYTNNPESLFFKMARSLGTPELMLTSPPEEKTKKVQYLIREA
jgi:hypothetical protein